ncbi:RabGAP TBC [Coniophora puteana RWD-64-598 SS2]|uniref:RabGAP TBC n=1 Tax=Coniophora puteana (strain RWD-64-598) TaxID=741705 RepID=A0A5M3MVB9_CONPW|nr:RabGAP TBC [Coniophora puteana RWD-64-598 SS2]EIW83073.1 RabGAP TBC [Coniophora puteana RWD-64-598 SS2]
MSQDGHETAEAIQDAKDASPSVTVSTEPLSANLDVAEPEAVTSPLDSLLSPKIPSFPENQPAESIRDSTNESTFTDDDLRFSTVTLSRRSSTRSLVITSPPPQSPEVDRAVSQASIPRRSIPKHPTHKKSASAATVNIQTPELSSSVFDQVGVVQRYQDEHDVDKLRANTEGQNQIRVEFERLHRERRKTTDSGRDLAVDWDFWGEVISDYQAFAASKPVQLAKSIEMGIPATLRGMMWQLMAGSKDAKLEATYLGLLKERSPHEKAITRDLGRTFPHHEFFTDGQGIGQENLFNVLKAYSLYDPQVGYCQGLPFIVAILLLNMPDEEAFSLLVRFMQSYNLRGHFLPEMPTLQLRLTFTQFDRLIEDILPALHLHFLRQGIKSSMYCSQWFLTLFSYRFPLDVVFRIYDNCLASGIDAIFAFGIVLLQKNEDALLALKFDDILAFLKNRVFDQYQVRSGEAHDDAHKATYNADAFVTDAISLKITPFMLQAYAHEYEDLVRTRDAHATEMDGLRNQNRTLMAHVKQLDDDLAQLNSEHVEVLNQLVMARLKNEEMEEELVRYKLLYAEAMHESADAMSSHRLSSPMPQINKRTS